MLNKKQTLFNKKLTMFNVFLFLAIVFSSIVCFVPLVTQKEINTDLACESGTAVESITENILQLNYVSSKNIKPSSDRYVSDEYLDQGSWEVDGVDTGHVSGGTYIVIEYNTTANVWEITYTYKGENTIKSYIANNGYELTSIKVLRGDSGGVLAFTIVINQTRIEKILNASDEEVRDDYLVDEKFQCKPEDIISSGYDPTSNKSIFFQGVVKPLIYNLNLYYQENFTTTSFSVKNAEFNVREALDLTTSNSYDDDISNFGYWMVKASAISSGKYNTNYAVEVNASTKVLNIKATGVDIKLSYEKEIKNGDTIIGYKLVSLQEGSYGTLLQITSDPLIVAKLSREYDLKITSGSGGWNNSALIDSTQKQDLVGAHSNNDTDTNYYETKVLIKNSTPYEYKFMDSELSATEGLSFYKKTDFGDSSYEKADAGWYYVFNYGYKITSYKAYINYGGKYYGLDFDGDIWSIGSQNESVGSISAITIETFNNSSFINFSNFADLIDIFFAGQAVSASSIVVKLEPVWASVDINLTNTASDPDKEAKLSYNSDYELGADDIDGKSLINFKTTKIKPGSSLASIIVVKGTYNYIDLHKSQYGYSAGTYTLEVVPEYVDNIYKLDLHNVSGASLDTLNVDNYKQATTTYSNNMYSYKTYKQTGYEFVGYQSGLIENYITNTFNSLKSAYIDGACGTFEILNKVYGANPYIYLTNNQNYKMPVFVKDNYELIFYNNKTDDNVKYKTYVYDAASGELLEFYKEAANDYKFEDYPTWNYTDGGRVGEFGLKAYWFRKYYNLNINTLLGENEAFHGYAKVVIEDTVATGADDKSGNYVVLYYNGGMKIYSHSQNTIKNLALSNYLMEDDGSTVEFIKLYAGCDLSIKAYDQSQDKEAFTNDSYIEMVGYRYVSTTSDLLDADSADVLENIYSLSNSYEVVKSAADFTSLGLVSGLEIEVNVIFEEIVYNFAVELDNHAAGDIVVSSKGVQSLDVKSYTVDSITAEEKTRFEIEYEAATGFGFQADAFILYKNSLNNRLQSGNIKNASDNTYLQSYTFTFKSEWLRDQYYNIFDNDYSTEDCSVGIIYINTENIEFKFGVKIYDASSDAENGIIFSDDNDYSTSFTLNNEGVAELNSIADLLKVYNGDIYIYEIAPGAYEGNYTVLNSRMYFVNNYLTTNGNNFTPYPFVLNEAPNTKFNITSAILSKMVSVDVDTIVPDEMRTIYIMLEVRKLLTNTIEVVESDMPDPNGDRFTTIINGENSSATAYNFGSATMYSYYGATNRISSTFDTKRYTNVKYYLDNYVAGNINTPLNDIAFESTDNHTLFVKYIPKSIAASVQYFIDGEQKNENYFVTNNLAKNISLHAISTENQVANLNELFVGYKLIYSIELVQSLDYTLTLKVNDVDVTASYLDNILQHTVANANFDSESIVIYVNLTSVPTDKIQAKLVLINSNQYIDNEPYYGEISIYEDGLLQENVNNQFATDYFVMANIAENRKVEIAFNLAEGYEFYGIKFNNNSINTNVEINENSTYQEGTTLQLYTINQFTFNVHNGIYLIYLNKLEVRAQLNVYSENKIYNITNNHSDTSINPTGTVQTINNLFVNDKIELKSEENSVEKLKYFYYTNAAGEKVLLYDSYEIDEGEVDINGTTYFVYNNIIYVDNLFNTKADFAYSVEGDTVIVPNKQLVLNSDILKTLIKNDNVYYITFGIESKPKYQVSYSIVGVEYVEDFKVFVNANKNLLSNPDYIPEECASGNYYETGTNINLFLTSVVPGKYDISIVENNSGTAGDSSVELNNKTYVLTSDLSLIIYVTPARFNVSINENIYTNIVDLNNSQPTFVESEQWVNGYNSNQIAKYNILKTLTFNLYGENNKCKLFEMEIESSNLSQTYYFNESNSKLYIDDLYTTEVNFEYVVNAGTIIINGVDYTLVENTITVNNPLKIKIQNNEILYYVNNAWENVNSTSLFELKINTNTSSVMVTYNPENNIKIKLNYLDIKSITQM